ncbi:histidinol-phosphatase HisJ [Neobacillus cucumis]|uniref:histidinol-phosphatase HisJ n=1 Tax=Neobacillus cucumis TaxID=1740721 RepID=UPI001962CA69|nr:histidinol-phosphatase HisJ [Neobacillus cucumis]MBM7651291.1 histidinol-phosphatase (PHP family) [Neobacillus cucumis]
MGHEFFQKGRDGHTHTHFCKHGSEENAELYIIEAIKKGFQQYSFTEHPPLPFELTQTIPNGQWLVDELAMSMNELKDYFKIGKELKDKYQEKIDILVGLEVDFISGMESFTRDLLDSHELEDGLLSVHFLPGKDGWRCVDFSAEDFQDGLVKYYGSVEKVYDAYYEMVEESIEANLGPNKPSRIGHLTLIHKYQDFVRPKDPNYDREHITKILSKVKQSGMELDVNLAGLFQPMCKEIYPPIWVIEEAVKLGVPLVYGSDSHKVEHVGRGYDYFIEIMNQLAMKPF